MMKIRTVETRHAPVQVLTGGAGDDLVFLHGAGGITADDPLLAILSQHWRVHAPLLPGYGMSAVAPGLRDMLDVTLHEFDVLHALGVRNPLLVGHSMGGMIAAEMAATCPTEVERLALIAPAGLWLDEHPIPDIFALLPHQFPPLLFHDVALGERLITGGLDLDDPKFLIDFLVTNARQFGMAGKLLFPLPERGLRDRTYRIRARTLLIWGASDRLITLPYAAAFQEAIREARLVTIPEAGHLVTLEKPEAVAEALGRI
jgi:pimeloyl-ACP methyl ester carboxylesterase